MKPAIPEISILSYEPNEEAYLKFSKTLNRNPNLSKKIDLKLSTMDRPVHENNYVKSSLDLSVFEMLKLNSSYHLGYDQKQQKRKEHQQQQQNIKILKNHTRNFPPGKKRNYFFVMAPHFRRNESFLLQ